MNPQEPKIFPGLVHAQARRDGNISLDGDGTATDTGAVSGGMGFDLGMSDGSNGNGNGNGHDEDGHHEEPNPVWGHMDDSD